MAILVEKSHGKYLNFTWNLFESDVIGLRMVESKVKGVQIGLSRVEGFHAF